jgi:hypothetical protein
MTAGDWGWSFVVYGGGGALVLWIIWAFIKHDLEQRRVLGELLAGGFKVDHQVRSTTVVVFDDSLREMAIIDGPILHRYSYGQIDGWTYEYLDRNGRQTRNKFVITVLDAKHPRHEIDVSATEAKLWLAKMRAILAQ